MAEAARSDTRQRYFSEEQSWIRRAGYTLYLAVKDLMADNGPQWAAAIAYYALLSAFPLILAAVSILSFFVDAQWVIDNVRSLLGSFLPRDTGQLYDIVNQAIQLRGTVSVFSILGFLWTGTRVFGAAIQGLNIIYDAKEEWGVIKRFLLELGLLAMVGTLFLLAFAAQPLVQLVWNALGLDATGFGFRATQYITMAVLLFVSFLLAYRFMPKCNVTWRSALAGAISATVLFFIAQPLFGFYIGTFANYNLIYGSLAIAVILVFWAWIFGMIFLFSGEVASYVHAYLHNSGEATGNDCGAHKLRKIREAKKVREKRS